MRDTVIIPTFDRPEFLWLCLENLWENVRGARDKFIMVSEDIHADKPKCFQGQMEYLAVIREWERKWGFLFAYNSTPPHTTYGNSLNVLSALQRAHLCGQSEKTYLIEDDVLVTPDFFEWNDMVFNQYRVNVVCAGRLNRSLNFQMNGRDAMDETCKDVNAIKKVKGAYISWATCFSADMMERMFSQPVTMEGFRPGFEQDIWIQTYMRREGIESIWPYVPRAYHMGWYSYHRDGSIPLSPGKLEERVQGLHVITRSESKLRNMAASEMDAFPTTHHEAATRLYSR